MKANVLAVIAAFALAACASREAPANGPALYVARDADSTLYLYGTIHLRRPGEPWGSPAVERALGESDEIWTEMEVSPEADARVQQLVAEYGRAPANASLSSWLTQTEAARLAQAERRLGIAPATLEPMQPWLAGLTLTLMPIVRAGYDPNSGVDRAVDAFGDARGKRMRAFETPEQQIGFFGELPPQMQREMLLEAIDEADRGAQSLDEMSEAWESGDEASLQRLLNADMRDEYPEVYDALITRRNAAWIDVLMRELDGAGVDFVAVGAAHVIGPDGLVARLRAHGVVVDRVE